MGNVVDIGGPKMPREFAEMRAGLDFAIGAQRSRVRSLSTDSLRAMIRYQKTAALEHTELTLSMADDALGQLIETELRQREAQNE